MYKQIIIARKDLNMSTGKFAAQVSHASMAFLINQIKESAHKKLNSNYQRCPAIEVMENGIKRPFQYRRSDLQQWSNESFKAGERSFYIKDLGNYKLEKSSNPEFHMEVNLEFDLEMYTEWMEGSFTKVVLEAKNKNKLMQAVAMAKSLGMIEGKDFFLIKDNCYTELTPEEEEDGVGKTLTCVGFRPMDAEVIDQIGKKFQMYH